MTMKRSRFNYTVMTEKKNLTSRNVVALHSRRVDFRGGRDPQKYALGGPKSKGLPPNKNKHVFYLSWILTK